MDCLLSGRLIATHKAASRRKRDRLSFVHRSPLQRSTYVSTGSIALFVLTLAAVASTRADEALPSQDQALAQALENHPDIVEAKAKIALADAELYGKRIAVSRQVLGLYGSLKMLDAQIDAAKVDLKRLAEVEKSKQAAFNAGASDRSLMDALVAKMQAAEAQLVQTIGQREQAEKELRLLIGTGSSAAEVRSPNQAAAAVRQTPQGPIVEQMKIAQEKLVKLEFDEMPLNGFLQNLSNETGIMFSVQQMVLDDIGFPSDEPITLHTNEVPLCAALQAFEDAYEGFQFVLRDYGVLLTTKGYAQEHGYVPVLEASTASPNTEAVSKPSQDDEEAGHRNKAVK